jgi:hypothetical protein
MKTNYKLVNMYLDSRRHSAKPFMLAVLFAITIIIIGIVVH